MKPPFGPNVDARYHQNQCFQDVPGAETAQHKDKEWGQQPTGDRPVAGGGGRPRNRTAAASAAAAQQVITITTCSRGSFSLIYFLSTYPS